VEEFDKIVNTIVDCLGKGNKVLTFGVGGNAANAIHFAAELQGKFEKYEKPLACMDLCSNVSVLTAITNDFGWEHVFERQIRGLAKPGDVVVAFSIGTTGKYLVNAIDGGLELGCKVILICGNIPSTFLKDRGTGQLEVLELESSDTAWVQEKQLELIHKVCREVKARLA
jgi:D-sedoheptulose 7-phosphate isomerase